MQKSRFDYLWDLCCALSLVGVWPRFVEPNIIRVTKVVLPVTGLPPALEGLKIVQFSDLHFHSRMKGSFIDRLARKISAIKPDIIVFTGDLLCYSRLEDSVRLRDFLRSLRAPYGCYAIFGNHDYEKSVKVNEFGEYDLVDEGASFFIEGLRRVFAAPKVTGKVSARARNIAENGSLAALFKEASFTVLHNETKKVEIKESALNVTGMGEYVVGRFSPEEAFRDYDCRFPGIVLAHNPDCVPFLSSCPGQIILCGHTHGGQINLPFIWKRITLLENPEFKRGLKKMENKWIYVNRGVGSAVPFRLFSPPEILELTITGRK